MDTRFRKLRGAWFALWLGCASLPIACSSVPARETQEARLAAARAAWRANESESAAIWVGRRLAYLGRYREAIDWFERMLARWPDSYRLRRHLGHRLITTRRLDAAVDVLTEAHRLAAGHPNRIEADGAPNAHDTPRSSTHGNIDYHLALAHYLRGEFDEAASCWRRCATEWAMTDDSIAAAVHWLHVSLHRAGRSTDADTALALLPDDADVIENFSYRDLVRLYQGRRTPESFEDSGGTPAAASAAYGLARWYVRDGQTKKGHAMLERLTASSPWAAFGVVAAEADLARSR